MSTPSGCSDPQQSQRERVEQWVFWDLCLCSRSGRYAYHRTADGVIAPRKSQWSKHLPCFPKIHVLDLVQQEVLLAVTTSAEGTLSVDNSTADTVTTPQYLKSLFPELSHDQITTGTTHYADLGTPIEQARSIMSECE